VKHNLDFHPLYLAAAIIALSLAGRWLLRPLLGGVDAPALGPWGGQVIFGYYLALFLIALPALLQSLKKATPRSRTSAYCSCSRLAAPSK
jgi:hypothetical protein